MKQNSSIRAKVRSVCALLALAIGLAMAAFAAQAQGTVVPPNGTLSADVVDLSVQGAGGAVQWKRTFNGAGWRFNRHWDGISASYKPVMTQNTGGGSPGASSAGEPAVCWNGHQKGNIPPHYGAEGPGMSSTTHHTYPSSHDPSTNR